MDLLDRYLAEIRRNLPAGKANDIVAEIADELHSQIDEGADPIDVIRAYGPPNVVAARYTGAQHLIGAELFPTYRRVLQIVITTVPAMIVLASVLRSMMIGSLDPFIGSVGIALEAALYIFAIITLIFAALERSGHIERTVTGWNPDRLPPAGVDPHPRPRSAFEFLANAGMMLVLFTIFGSGHGYPSLTFAPNAVLTIAWQPAYAAAVIASAVVALGALAIYINPYLTKIRYVAHLIGNGLVIGGLGLTLRAGPLISGAPSHLNDTATWIVIIVIAAVAIGTAVETRPVIMGRLSS